MPINKDTHIKVIQFHISIYYRSLLSYFFMMTSRSFYIGSCFLFPNIDLMNLLCHMKIDSFLCLNSSFIFLLFLPFDLIFCFYFYFYFGYFINSTLNLCNFDCSTPCMIFRSSTRHESLEYFNLVSHAILNICLILALFLCLLFSSCQPPLILHQSKLPQKHLQFRLQTQ